MANPRDVKVVQQSLAWLEGGRITEQEVIDRLAITLTGDTIDEVFETVSPEHHSLIHAGLREAIQRRADEDCLQPEHSPFDPIYRDVNRQAGEVLLAPAPDEPSWSQFTAVCLPSFQSAWALRLVRPHKEFPVIRVPTLITTVANGSIWGAGERPATTTRHLRPVQDELASRLETLWERMLLTTRASRHVGSGLDGVTYHFTFRHKAGRTWSPRSDTRAGRFVELTHTLAHYTAADEIASPRIEAELLAQLEWFRF